MINLLDVIWLLCIIPLWTTYLLLAYLPDKVPDVLVSAFLYGKLSKNNAKASALDYIAIPKRWFAHFYQYSVILFAMWTVVLVWAALTGSFAVPRILEFSMNILIHDRTVKVPFAITLWVQLLMNLQVLCRCYECMYVSVYSDVKMHIWHFAMGFIFYTGIQYSLLSLSVSADAGSQEQLSVSLHDLYTRRVILGTVMWAAAFWLQRDTTKRFADFRNVRFNKLGKTAPETSGHVLPYGGFFDYVSSPHYFAEIMIYTGLTVILGWSNSTWILSLIWTYVNQIAVALLSHRWYQRTFKYYPPDRKAVIPFLM